jgi:TPR repeat protein
MDAAQSKSAVDEALRAHDEGRHAAAFKALKRLSANGGDAEAFHMLGYMYDNGQGTRRNSRLALQWYLRSFGAGLSISAMNIATIYRDRGDRKREFEWYRRAADLGDGDAKVEVAIRYLSGKGVRRNRNTAIRFLEEALKAHQNLSESGRDTAVQLLHGCRNAGSRASNGISASPICGVRRRYVRRKHSLV